MRDDMIDNYRSLSQLHPRKDVESWLNESTVATLKDGEWCSVYRLKVRKCEHYSMIL